MPTFDDLRRAQDDVLSRVQLRSFGIHHDTVAAQLTARRWQTLGPRIVVLHNGPLTAGQRQWAAVLNSGGVLAGNTAATLHGLRGYTEEVVHVLVARGAKVPRLAGVAVHESRRFDADRDRHPARTPPTVRVERALIDMAAWSRTARRGCGVLASGVQQRLTQATRLHGELVAAGSLNHCRTLRAVLLDIEGGAQALSELDFVALCRRHRLPEPRRQVVRLDAQGRRRYLDADFDGFSVEVDGAVHLGAIERWADDQRHNELVLVHERQLRVPSVIIRIDEPAVADLLRRAHAVFSRRAA